MRKTFCDVCGKELTSGDCHYFDDFDTCSDCYKIIENHYELWEEVKLDTFREFASELKAAAKKPAAKKLVAVKTTCCGKCRQHKHELVTAAEPAAKSAAKPAAKKPVAKSAKPAAKKPAAKLITTSELANEIGRKPNIVQCYAYRNKLGRTDKMRRVRLYNQEEVDKIRKHFEK